MKKSTPPADWLTGSVFEHQTFFSLHSGPPEPISLPVELWSGAKDRLAEFSDEPAWSASIATWGKDHSLCIEADEE
jgi:hypothetical protein